MIWMQCKIFDTHPWGASSGMIHGLQWRWFEALSRPSCQGPSLTTNFWHHSAAHPHQLYRVFGSRRCCFSLTVLKTIGLVSENLQANDVNICFDSPNAVGFPLNILRPIQHHSTFLLRNHHSERAPPTAEKKGSPTWRPPRWLMLKVESNSPPQLVMANGHIWPALSESMATIWPLCNDDDDDGWWLLGDLGSALPSLAFSFMPGASSQPQPAWHSHCGGFHIRPAAATSFHIYPELLSRSQVSLKWSPAGISHCVQWINAWNFNVWAPDTNAPLGRSASRVSARRSRGCW